jgi:hypothetical protein
MGVRVTSKEYAIEETARDRPAAAKKDGDRLAVSLTHPKPVYTRLLVTSTVRSRSFPKDFHC